MHHKSALARSCFTFLLALYPYLMSRTYKAIGINLKAMPLGEADRVLTILTKEHGLVRAVAMGARKQNSKLSGRSGLFVVNDLLLANGRSLDKVTQAETLESYPGLSRNLKKLTAAQYLAELTLQQALSDQPQDDLFDLLTEHLDRIERSVDAEILPRLTHAIFQLLVVAGIAPQVHQCCVTQAILDPDLNDPNWKAGFSSTVGGVVTPEVLERILQEQPTLDRARSNQSSTTIAPKATPSNSAKLNILIDAAELSVLQQLAQAELTDFDRVPASVWLALEHLLRQYAQYHFDRIIRSALMIESCFAPVAP